MAGRQPAQPSLRGLFQRVTNTIRATERTLQGVDLTIDMITEASGNVKQCRLQLERLFLVAPENIVGQTLLRDLRLYEGLLHQEEVKIIQLGGHNTQYQVSKLSSGCRGASKYQITKRSLEILLVINCPLTLISKTLGVSLSTVKRRMNEYGLSLRSKYATLADDDLDDIVNTITEHTIHLGYRSVQAQLRSKGMVVQETRVRKSMERVNSAAVAMRWGNAVQRRTYYVPTPNALWHIDGNHKLIRWKLVIHGGIDGYSRMVTFLKVSPNNYSRTVLAAFREATTKFGIPSRVRMDHGVENGGVFQFMEESNGTGRGSAIRGRSVHNQRIERLWLDVYMGVNHTFRTTFTLLEEMGLLDVDNDIYIFCLHYVYLDRVQEKLDAFRQQYNCHNLSTEHNKTPQQLFVVGTLAHFNSNHRGITGQRALQGRDDRMDRDDLEIYGVEDHMGPEEGEESTVNVPTVNCPLSDRHLQQLRHEIPPNNPQDPLGVDTYRRVVEFVARYMTE